MRSILCLLIISCLAACTTVKRNPGPIHEISMTPPELIQLGDAKYWIVARPIRFMVVVDDQETEYFVTVPKGFVTDLASTPKLLWGILPPTDRYMAAAILHDYLYWSQKCDKNQSDLMLFVAMKSYGVPGWKRDLVYIGVLNFGMDAFERNAAERAGGGKRFLKSTFVDQVAQRNIDRGFGWGRIKGEAAKVDGFGVDDMNPRVDEVCRKVRMAHSVNMVGTHASDVLDVRNDVADE